MRKIAMLLAKTATKPAETKATRDTTAAREVVSMRLPTMASNAGSKVTDATIMTATPIAIPTASPFTKDKPIASKPRSATMTVIPAKTTARPEVSIASMMDSSTVNPSCSASRNRVTINRA